MRKEVIMKIDYLTNFKKNIKFCKIMKLYETINSLKYVSK